MTYCPNWVIPAYFKTGNDSSLTLCLEHPSFTGSVQDFRCFYLHFMRENGPQTISAALLGICTLVSLNFFMAWLTCFGRCKDKFFLSQKAFSNYIKPIWACCISVRIFFMEGDKFIFQCEFLLYKLSNWLTGIHGSCSIFSIHGIVTGSTFSIEICCFQFPFLVLAHFARCYSNATPCYSSYRIFLLS